MPTKRYYRAVAERPVIQTTWSFDEENPIEEIVTDVRREPLRDSRRAAWFDLDRLRVLYGPDAVAMQRIVVDERETR